MALTDKHVVELLRFIKEDQRVMKSQMESMLVLQQNQIDQMTKKAGKFDELFDVVQNLSDLVKRSLQSSIGNKQPNNPFVVPTINHLSLVQNKQRHNCFSVPNSHVEATPKQTSGSVLPASTIDKLLLNLQIVSRKLDDLQPQLKLIENVQLQADTKGTGPSSVVDKNDDDINKTLDALLTGRPHERSQVCGFHGKVVNAEGVSQTLTAFIRVMMTTPWITFPLSYAMECSYCYREQVVNVGLRADRVSVHCKACLTNTVIGAPKFGFQWVLFSACDHYQQIEIGDHPRICSICGTAAKFTGADHTTRTPRKLE